MGASTVWDFIKSLIDGVESLRLMYFHFLSFRMITFHSFTINLVARCSFLVTSYLEGVKLLSEKKACTFLLYLSAYITIMELHLTDLTIMTLDYSSLYLICFRDINSCLLNLLQFECCILR